MPAPSAERGHRGGGRLGEGAAKRSPRRENRGCAVWCAAPVILVNQWLISVCGLLLSGRGALLPQPLMCGSRGLANDNLAGLVAYNLDVCAGNNVLNAYALEVVVNGLGLVGVNGDILNSVGVGYLQP